VPEARLRALRGCDGADAAPSVDLSDLGVTRCPWGSLTASDHALLDTWSRWRTLATWPWGQDASAGPAAIVDAVLEIEAACRQAQAEQAEAQASELSSASPTRR
jgi:hypothetical protein